MNSNRSSKQSQGKAKAKNNPNKGQKPKKEKHNDAPSARMTRASNMLGLRDLLSHEMPFQYGLVYVGNGTLGATDGVYFANTAKTAVQDNAPFHVPIRLNSDGSTGAVPLPTFVTDIVKHFARVRVRKLTLELVSLQPSTANSMTLCVGPIRAAGDTSAFALTTGTTAGASYGDVISMAGARQCASWESMKIDLTPFIAGGSGAKQNEFDLDFNEGYADLAPRRTTPAAFVVSGTNSTAALRGTATHMVIVRPVLDLLDFIAGAPVDGPLAIEARILKPSRDVLNTLEYLGGSSLLKLLESRQAALREKQSSSLPMKKF